MHEQTWPALATTQSITLQQDWDVFALAGLCVAVLVGGLLFYALIRWRRKDDRTPPQFQRNAPLEFGWTAIPFVLIVALFLYTFHIESIVESVSAHPTLTVNVDAFRWGWRFSYPGGPTVIGSTASPELGVPHGEPPELVLPVAQITRIVLTSSDVAHSFWVPDFLFKRDAIPGRVTSFDLDPVKVGTYLGHCAEFCGINHGIMTFRVRVVSAPDFHRWLQGARHG